MTTARSIRLAFRCSRSERFPATLSSTGINNFDLSLIKNTHITESKMLQFRAEFFNAFNHAQFLNPNNDGSSDSFGVISTDRGMRIIQFGLKLLF